MRPAVTPMMWLGQPALALETPALRLITVPGMGAKIVSLMDRQAGREWLLPPIGRAFKPVAYAAAFGEQDMSGWDEMFPTINAGAYPGAGMYDGAALPDHGEVWSLPWQVDAAAGDAITLTVVGRALPYRLTRTARLLDSRTLRLDFTATNTGDAPFSALWAAHPQFAVDENTRIVLPASVTHVINVHATDGFPDIGQAVDWPCAQTASGQLLALDRAGTADLHRCRKFYVPPDAPVSWAALQQEPTGSWLRLSWDASDVPYLGLWVDEGVYNAAPTIALEPATGYYDSLTLARANDRVAHFLPGEPRRWHLDITVGSGPLETPTT